MTYSTTISTLTLNWLAVGGRFCLVSAGLLAPWIAIAALPIFRFGIWIDVEPTLVVFHWIAALFAGGLILDRMNSSHIFVHPILAGIGALIALSLITMPFALDIGLTWYGLPDSGQGILSLIGFTFMLFGFKRLIDEGYSRFLWINTTAAILMIGGFTLFGNIWGHGTPFADWSPYVFSAFMAFMAIGLLALSLTCESQNYRLSGIVLSGIIILLSMNKTAIMSLGVLLVIFESKTISNYIQKLGRVIYTLIVALCPLIILASMILFSGPAQFPTLWSRVRIIQMVGLEMLEHPSRLLVGYGWGSYTDTFLANMTRVGEAMYQQGVWNPTWDGLSHINSHSHHQVTEALLSTGIFGALIVLILPALAVYVSDRDKLPFAFIVFFLYAATSSGWFEIPATLPFIALSYSVFWPKNPLWNKAVSSSFLLPLCTLGAVLCIVGGARCFNVAIAYPGPSSLISANYGVVLPFTCDRAIEAAGPGSAQLARHLQTLIEEAHYSGYRNGEVTKEISELVCAAKTIKQPNISLMIPLLTLTNDLAKVESFREVKSLRQELLPQWRSKLEAVLTRAPYRTDLLVPYFRWQMRRGKSAEIWDWCNQILSRNPRDPIALWFKGLILKKNPDDLRKGYAFLKRSLDAGVSRVIPIAPELEQQIRVYYP
jgi:hypothetical protein